MYLKLVNDKTAFFDTLAAVENGERQLDPRLFINLFKVCLRNRKDLRALTPRVLALHRHVTGGKYS